MSVLVKVGLKIIKMLTFSNMLYVGLFYGMRPPGKTFVVVKPEVLHTRTSEESGIAM